MEKYEEIIRLKELREEIRQEISCRIKLINYKENEKIKLEDERYSVYEIKGKSAVNKTYNFDITFVSEGRIEVEDIVDTDVEVLLQDEVNPLVKKRIYGKIYKASEDSIVGKKYLYKIKVVSPLKYLGLNKRYEIYQEKKVSDIIVEILNRYKQLLNINIEVKLDLIKAPIKEYTTQYNQSDLDFILMLCEEEGYSLIIDYSNNNPYSIILCELNEHATVHSYSSTCSFNHSKEFKATNIIEDYYDKDKPSLEYKTQTGSSISSSIKDNESTKQLRNDIKRNNFRNKLNLLDESYYKDIQRYTKIQSQREYVKSNIIKADSQELNIQDSLCIKLEDEKINKSLETIIIKVEYKGFFPNALDEYKQNINEKEKHKLQYEVNIEAIPKDINYKSPIKTKKPKINSTLTAKVSNGNPNTKDYENTIDVDEQGRIRVLFHFEENQTTSTYLRVSNIHSGNTYGTQFLPRVNQEVIVSFINGDPDQPIIIGSLHNAENKIAVNLPKDKTKSFIKTNSMPQYPDKIGYNELLFEDKRGEEELSLRAQRDLNIHALNNKNTHIENNSKTIIQNDKEETISNNLTQTIGKELIQNIKTNHIQTIQKEKISTVKEDYELHVLKDLNTIVKNDLKTIVEENSILRVKGTATQYMQEDVKKKYLQNLFSQIGKDFRLDVQNTYHLKAKDIKKQAQTIEIVANKGISLRCGTNVLSLDSLGIHLKSPIVDTISSNKGVEAKVVLKQEIKKPLYEKIKVIELIPTIINQDEITQILKYTAKVQKYQNDTWIQTTQLNPSQEAQLQWVFVKNNDENDKNIVLDNPTNDAITINGLEMSVSLEKQNIYKYAHVHCYVIDSKSEGYAKTSLKRYLEVEDIIPINISQEEAKCEAILNVDEPRAEELEQIRWTVETKEVPKYKGKEQITHNLKEEKVNEINFTSYIEGFKQKAANAMLTYDERVKQLTNLRFENE